MKAKRIAHHKHSLLTRPIVLTTLALLSSLFVYSIFPKQPASAVTGADWSAGKIISDNLFFNPASMSDVDIQNFLNIKVPNCDTWGNIGPYYDKDGNRWNTRADFGRAHGNPPPYTCLKDYIENPTTRQNNANGGSVSGGLSAAQIIKNASNTYGISPKVLIVLLQKEQSLVTDDWPWVVQYRSATGYGCPDTAPCDEEYYGFYNQVTKAAYQFQRYAQNPNGYRKKALQNNFIQWHPDFWNENLQDWEDRCGGTDVYIQNQATAGLYNYTPYQPNSTALSDLYGSQDDGCSSYGNRNFWRMYNDWFGSTQHEERLLIYKSHVSKLGWTNSSENTGMTGTVGQSKAMEALKILGEVEYSSYNFNTGWQPTVSNGMISGTTGMSRPIQAIKINPTGSLAGRYDIYYRTHVSYVGWMGWTKNGLPAGVTGDSTKNIEAIEVQLVIKGHSIAGTTANSYQNLGEATYSPSVAINIASHVGTVGWQPSVTDTMVSGTTEQDKRIEAIRINLINNEGLSGNIVYSAHVSGIGWQDFRSSGQDAGTTGQYRQMEAVRIALTGALGDKYDIWYRGYVKLIGWLDWNKNGAPVGSVGASRQLEAIEIRLTLKNSVNLPQQTPLYNPNSNIVPESYNLDYSTHIGWVGWVGGVKQNVVGGTTGQSKPLESVRFDSLTSIFGEVGISCSAYVKNTGWTGDVSVGNICGTTGQAKPLESLKLSLSGDAAGKYDLYYKVHVSYEGWKEWVKNGELAGTPSSGRSIEAIIVKLVQK